MRLNEVFTSGKTWKAEDLEGKDLTLKITSVEPKKFDDGPKLILKFHGTDVVLITNKTNAETISELYGDDTDEWAGKRITLFPTKTKFGTQKVACIRIRETVPNGKPPVAETGGKRPAPRTEPGDDDDDDVPY